MSLNPPNTSVRNLSSLLHKVTVLVYDPDPPIAGIVRHVLSQLGFGRILVTSDREEALDFFLENPIDFIITDHDTNPVRDGLPLITFIRTSPDSVQRTVPIIMLSGHTAEDEIIQARDAGITEFAAKPFTAKSLTDRIIRVIENPRSFIITKRYSGPDRRHREGEEEQAAQRRKSDKTLPVDAENPAAAEGGATPPAPQGVAAAPVYSGGGKVVTPNKKNIFKRLIGD